VQQSSHLLSQTALSEHQAAETCSGLRIKNPEIKKNPVKKRMENSFGFFLNNTIFPF